MNIFSGSANKPLAYDIAKHLGIPLGKVEIHIFPDGERRVRIIDKVLDKDCIVVQPTAPPADTHFMELFFIADGLKRSGAKSITAVVPYLGYQRQDHVFREGEAVSLTVVVKMLETAGVNSIITLDLHSIKIPEFFKIPVVHISALPLFAEKIREIDRAEVANENFLVHDANPHGRDLKKTSFSANAHSENFVSSPRSPVGNSVLVSPDMGGIRRIKLISEMLGNMPYASIIKNRDLATGKVEADIIQGEVKKRAFIVDDMISSGGTIATASRLLKKHGVEEIYVFATHAVFSQLAPKFLQESQAKKVYVTNTIFVPEEKLFPKLEIISVSDIIASEIHKY
ncbi:MAG: ribose-phosphate pyrophosphokinase [Candidatus Levybacteria bacterium]|nr:ribose-phosphate pyrophosphokinase [Candidatus Levybacteria bacterium]